MPPLYDREILTRSSFGEDMKWSACVLGMLLAVVGIIGLLVSALLR